MAENGNAFVAPTGSSALFLDESVVQGGFDADESNVDLAAMKALMDETPEETAEILKVNLTVLDIFLSVRFSCVKLRLESSVTMLLHSFVHSTKPPMNPVRVFAAI